MKKIYINPKIEIIIVEMYQIMQTGSLEGGGETDQNLAPDLIDFGDDDVDW